MSRILVTGGRAYTDADAVDAAMDKLMIERGWKPEHTIVIEGGAHGADTLAREWAGRRRLHVATCRALWSQGKGAGMKRNAAMLLLLPTLCVAFPGGRGTANMITLCEKQGIPVWRPYG